MAVGRVQLSSLLWPAASVRLDSDKVHGKRLPLLPPVPCFKLSDAVPCVTDRPLGFPLAERTLSLGVLSLPTHWKVRCPGLVPPEINTIGSKDLSTLVTTIPIVS